LISKAMVTQLEQSHFTHLPFLNKQPLTSALLSLKKIEKALSRGYLWNALHCLGLMRNSLMQVYRIYEGEDTQFMGRVNRDIELSMNSSWKDQFQATQPLYDVKDIASKTIALAEIFEYLLRYAHEAGEENIVAWAKKQIAHEKGKLERY